MIFYVLPGSTQDPFHGFMKWIRIHNTGPNDVCVYEINKQNIKNVKLFFKFFILMQVFLSVFNLVFLDEGSLIHSY